MPATQVDYSVGNAEQNQKPGWRNYSQARQAPPLWINAWWRISNTEPVYAKLPARTNLWSTLRVRCKPSGLVVNRQSWMKKIVHAKCSPHPPGSGQYVPISDAIPQCRKDQCRENYGPDNAHGLSAQRPGSGDGERRTLLTRQIAFEPLPASVLFGRGCGGRLLMLASGQQAVLLGKEGRMRGSPQLMASSRR